jgi:aminopeptidase N
MSDDRRRDECSLSNYQDACVEHADLDLSIDFAEKRVEGTVTYRVRVCTPGTTYVSFDTRHLRVTSVAIDGMWGRDGSIVRTREGST